jgi:hypothetical protein
VVSVLETLPGVNQRGAERLGAAGASTGALGHRRAAVGLERRGPGAPRERRHPAVGHAIVGRAFPRRSRNAPEQELGADPVDEPRRHQLVDHLARRMARLGYRVRVQPVTAA